MLRDEYKTFSIYYIKYILTFFTRS